MCESWSRGSRTVDGDSVRFTESDEVGLNTFIEVNTEWKIIGEVQTLVARCGRAPRTESKISIEMCEVLKAIKGGLGSQ